MKKSTAILVWGGLTAIILVIFYQILNATGQENSGLKWLSLLIMFSGIYMGTVQYRDKANEGYLTFGQGFKAGFFMCLIITIIAAIAIVIDMQMHTDYIDKILAQSRNSMINKGMTDDQIDISMHYMMKFMTPVWVIIWVVLFDLFFGILLSLITAGLCTRKKPIFDDANDVSSNDIPQA